MERTIKVTGSGRVSVKPDMIRLRLELAETYKEYETTLKESSEGTEEIRKILEKLGFERQSLKTIAFNINTEYENVNKGNSWKRVFNGYRYIHKMKFEFENNNKILGKLLYGLAHCSKTPKISVEYFVSDVESAKNELLKNAINDSAAKAEVLAKAAGVALGEIVSIDYSWGEVDFVTSPVRDFETVCTRAVGETASYDMDIEPEDIEKTDTVTVIWKIC